ncbi:MAG: shikimate dehydrogenase [Ruminococcaceae bacterium]|nr:shikimate dehydrogenase [Oscillospiraceae bacterium]
MQYGLIGKKLGHSFSKEVHTLLADYEYELLELPDEDAVGDLLTKKEFRAINVTIPYKQTGIPYLTEISPEARAIGAVNTIVNRDGKLYGYNTDFYGITAALARMGFTDFTGKRALILGTGGTSLTSVAVLRALGAVRVHTVSRTPKGTAISYEEALTKHEDTDILFNTTPVGMFPNADGCPISLSAFPRLACVFDAVYNPLSTRLVTEARERGIPADTGLYMLVAQAFRAVELFLDITLDPALLETTYSKILRAKQNVVLIGMPSSGKSTIGRALAEQTERPFIDLDEEIVKMAGRDIPTIFREEGEKGFRDIESEAVRIAAQKTGAVIATGGGAVLRGENVARLKQNGVLCLLDRPLEALTPTSDRPTASDRAAIEARYFERRPIYLAAKDYSFSVGDDFMTVVDHIRKELSL